MTSAAALEDVFHACFRHAFNTRLQGGAAEPFYQPPRGSGPGVIYYREDFSASLLHEVAHWCIAGESRRQLEDYGYWYSPDGRDAETQREFELVEVRPQAVEWHFALAGRVRFRVSHDNLALPGGGEAFHRAVADQARRFCREPLPPRAECFRMALAASFDGPATPAEEHFTARGEVA